MKKINLGVVEGFFGPQWENEKRKSYAQFLSEAGGDFYIYAPKEDAYLRKRWREKWDESYFDKLRDLKREFSSYNIQFGVGLSPLALGEIITPEDEKKLEERVSVLNDLEVDLIGLFFDDMPVTPNLAKTQISAVNIIRKKFLKKIIFCPSFYSDDPVLQKVFGEMPKNYFEDLALAIPSDVSFIWTGPKVISPEITASHLRDVKKMLRHEIIIWDNFFANDGPKNCKYLKVISYTGRPAELVSEVDTFAFNMMNQAELSKIGYLAAKHVLKDELAPAQALSKVIGDLEESSFKQFLLTHQSVLFGKNLDEIQQAIKDDYLAQLKEFKHPAAEEIARWLMGAYNVGNECLTD